MGPRQRNPLAMEVDVARRACSGDAPRLCDGRTWGTKWTEKLPKLALGASRRDGTVDVSHQRIPALVLVSSEMARGTSCRLDVSAGALSVLSWVTEARPDGC